MYEYHFLYKAEEMLGIVMIFILIIATIPKDKNNFTRVKDSVIVIYDDRLITNDLVCEI
jgi:hypothetical protein